MTTWKPVTENSPPPGKVVLLRKAKGYCFGTGLMSGYCERPAQDAVFIAKREKKGGRFHGGGVRGEVFYLTAEEWAEIPE